MLCLICYYYINNDECSNLGRRCFAAFQSFICAYAAYPASVKRVFHVKNLHLGHVATSFGLQEAPTKIGTIIGKQGRLSGDAYHKKT